MAAPKPQEISVEIEEQLRNFALYGGSHATVSLRMQSILDDCDKLAKVNAIDASLLRANLYAIAGDREKCEYWLRNAEKIGAGPSIFSARWSFLVLLGSVTEAYGIVDKAIGGTYSLNPMIVQTAACGMFRKAVEVLHRTKAEIEPKLKEDIIKSAAYVDQLELSDEKICKVMDIALGFLCENGLIWLGHAPDFRFLSHDSGGPLVSLTYRIDATHDEAARLNTALIDRLIAAELDSVGLLIGLQGTTTKVPESPVLA